MAGTQKMPYVATQIRGEGGRLVSWLHVSRAPIYVYMLDIKYLKGWDILCGCGVGLERKLCGARLCMLERVRVWG